MGGVNVDAGAHAATVLQLDRVHVTQQASAQPARRRRSFFMDLILGLR